MKIFVLSTLLLGAFSTFSEAQAQGKRPPHSKASFSCIPLKIHSFPSMEACQKFRGKGKQAKDCKCVKN